LEENDLLIIEGIHGLNEQLSRDIEAQYKYKIFISPLCPLNLDNQNNVYPEDIRLLRRLIRDKLTRGYSFNDTLNIWESVRRGEYKYILPYMENADTMFNSALLYEAAILKKYAYDELNELKSQNIRANYLVKFLNYFVSCDEEADIPQNSILREFIGKSCFFD
jgi:uridine kinase